jgi:RNA polymerase sporulation-specific sigma factor
VVAVDARKLHALTDVPRGVFMTPTLMDVLQDEGETVIDAVGRRFEASRVRAVMSRLSRREREVLQMRYGLLTGERLTQRDIARKLGISRSYVSRIEKKAVKRLFRELRAMEGQA